MILAVALGCATTGDSAGSGGSAQGQVGVPLPDLKVEAMSGKPIDVSS